MTNKLNPESEKLKKALDELVALNQIAGTINALMSVEDITKTIVDRCLKWTNSSQGAIFLLEGTINEAEKFKTFMREYSPDTDQIPFHINESLTGWMIKTKSIFVSNDPGSEENFKDMDLTRHGINSILSAPLLSRKGMIGSLILFNKKDPEGFNNDDRRFLGIVGSQVAQVIENARLHEQEQKLAEIEEEIRVARTIQQGFLPHSGERLKSCEIFGFNSPAREVGGDFFDIVRLSERRVFFSLGDVSGKGIPASLLMANAQAVFRSQLFTPGELKLDLLAGSLNDLINQFSSSGQFITAIFGYYDCKDKEIRYINAGHMAPIVIRNNTTIIDPDLPDIVIGVVKGHKYKERCISLENEDTCFIYSDGITDLVNDRDESFGDERLAEFLLRHQDDNVSRLCENMFRALVEFRGAAPQFDDITMVALKIRE